jgi:hypothetical protein
MEHASPNETSGPLGTSLESVAKGTALREIGAPGEELRPASTRDAPHSKEIVLVLPQKTSILGPQNGLKSFIINNFLVIVLGNPCRINTIQKQWGGGGVGVAGCYSIENK